MEKGHNFCIFCTQMEVNNHMLLFCLCVVFRFHLFVVDSEGFLQFFFHLLFIVLNHELGGNLGI